MHNEDDRRFFNDLTAMIGAYELGEKYDLPARHIADYMIKSFNCFVELRNQDRNLSKCDEAPCQTGSGRITNVPSDMASKKTIKPVKLSMGEDGLDIRDYDDLLAKFTIGQKLLPQGIGPIGDGTKPTGSLGTVINDPNAPRK
jgi:hypothetical protein